MTEIERLRAALDAIAQVANTAVLDGEYPDDAADDADEPEQQALHTCTLRTLPARLLVPAAETARRVNPVNAPSFGPLAAANVGFEVMEPLRLAVLTSKYWGPTPRRLTVSFTEPTPANLRARILSHMNAWTRTASISFVETSGVGTVRISRRPGGYWSYLGTDVLHIPRNRPTMNLEGFSMNTSEAEYKRVIRHETGHTLGFPHEHMRAALVARVDPEKAYAWFRRSQGWDRATVDSQVLTSLNERSLIATPPDQTSIMCYQLPGTITRDGRPILGGADINQTDYAFAGRIYPKAGQAPTSEAYTESDEPDRDAAAMDDWTEAEDVTLAEVAAAIEQLD